MSLDPLPEPPEHLRQRQLTLIEFSEPLYRTHGVKRNPKTPGSVGTNRFDAPDGTYDVVYYGRDPYCAFVETFAHPAGTRSVTTAALKSRALSTLRPLRPLILIDLTQSGSLFRIGADARLFTSEYNISQRWSKALHDHPAGVQGLLYVCRLDPTRQSVALFIDREPKLIELERQSWYASGPQRLLLAQIIEHYRIELIESHYVAPRKPVGSQIQEVFPELND